MFRLGASTALFALALVPLAAGILWYDRSSRRRALERFGDLELVRRLSETVSHRARLWKRALLLGALAFGTFALARPQFGSRVETVRREGVDLVVALDLSTSMLAEDVEPNRLQRSKLEIQRLIGRLDGDRIGLIAFAGHAFVQSPLTSDYAAARLFLNAMDTDLIPVQGTDLGAALDLALDAFPGSPVDERVIIVVTDGENHEEGIDEAVAKAVEAGVRIFTVGVGSSEGVPIPERDARGTRRGFKRDADGAVVTTRLDESTLRAISAATGGRMFRSTPEASELTALIEEIERIGGREIDAREITQFEEQYQIFLAVSIILLIIEMSLSDRRKLGRTWAGRGT
ncbi:MAG: VWA domain-containing protein [Gemmatimonadetes bacterium]|nr:VWA domain-containing protein [Gemmatimonadota bacterium]